MTSTLWCHPLERADTGGATSICCANRNAADPFQPTRRKKTEFRLRRSRSGRKQGNCTRYRTVRYTYSTVLYGTVLNGTVGGSQSQLAR